MCVISFSVALSILKRAGFDVYDLKGLMVVCALSDLVLGILLIYGVAAAMGWLR